MSTDCLCSHCENSEICKFSDEYNEELTKIGNCKNPLFDINILCKKYKDNRHYNNCIVDYNGTSDSSIATYTIQKNNELRETSIRCPVCGANLYKDESMIYLSNPPKYKYTCLVCGNIGYLEH